MPEDDLVELKFRLYDGTDIGPTQYSASSTVAMLKERIISEWPRGGCDLATNAFHIDGQRYILLLKAGAYRGHRRDKKMVPKAANDLRLISSGKILENNKTVAQCRTPFGELPGGVITMHVVVQPSVAKMKTEKVEEQPTKAMCSCSIL
uniref:Membrane-anchored ubiquitin-fold protein 3 n=1 Tax=Anthurium amnicola TaxID=1678845 RepID=A0A1D1YPQ0_9ARAE